MNRTHKLLSSFTILAFMFAMLGTSASVARAAGANRPLALQPAFRLIGDCSGRYFMNDGVIDLGVIGVWMGDFESTTTQVCTFHMSYPVDSGEITFWWWAADPEMDSWSLAFDGNTVLIDPALGAHMQSRSFAAGTLVTDMTIMNPRSTGNGSVFTFCFPGGCLDAGAPSAGDVVSPQLTVPANMSVQATNLTGAVVSFSASATDETWPLNPDVTCSPASGTTFPIGTSTVNCSATDLAENTGNASFNVTVTTIPTSGANLLFDAYFETVPSPTGWQSSSRTVSASSLWSCTVYLSPSCSITLKGVNSARGMTQTIKMSGNAAETFQFGLWSKTLGLPTQGVYTVELAFYNAMNRVVYKKTISLGSGTHDFQLTSGSLTTPKAYTKIVFTVILNKTSGSVWVDDAYLIRTP